MRKNGRRRPFLFTAIVVAVLGVGAYQAGAYLAKMPAAAEADPRGGIEKAFGAYEERLAVGEGYVVLTAAQNGRRELGYVVRSDGSWYLLGNRVAVQGTQGTQLRQDGNLVVVETQKEGAPQYTAFQYGSEGLTPVDYYTVRAPEPPVKTGAFLLVNKRLNALWYYEGGKLVKAYRVATGRHTSGPAPTWEDFRTNFFTPEGSFTLTDFKVNPAYNATKPGDQSYPGGDPQNPLGTRWMGFPVLQGDGGTIWGIHGTSEPEKVGTWASDGCIRMYTPEVEELFGRLKGQNPTLHVIAG